MIVQPSAPQLHEALPRSLHALALATPGGVLKGRRLTHKQVDEMVGAPVNLSLECIDVE